MNGLLLDTSILITAERHGIDVWNELLRIRRETATEHIGISSLTLMELAYGLARADTEQRKEARQNFLDGVSNLLEIHLVSAAIATVAGTVDAELSLLGIRVAPLDLLIGITARELGYAMATHNLRHFNRIPGLQVFAV